MAEEEAKKKPPKAEGTETPAAQTDEGAGAKPAAKKKEKPPAVEDKPFPEFIQEHYLPALKKSLAQQGAETVALAFEKQKIPVLGLSNAPECWQVIGRWQTDGKQQREFNVYFFNEDIKGQKGFSCSESQSQASTLESFLIDERKIDLGLLVFGTVQRLNAQKWLARN